MIPVIAWVPRGAARSRPVRFELSSEEYSRIKAIAEDEEKQEKAAENDSDDEHVQTGKTFAGENEEEQEENNFDDLPPELRMDEYDDEDSLNGANGDELEDEDIAVMEEGELAFAMDKDDFDEDDEEDNEDDEIRPTDSLLVVAIIEDEYSHLEVQLLSEDGNLYVHHDITLPDFPLSLAWLDCPPYQNKDSANGGQGAVGNYMAVGTFAPAIEIWNLDVLDPLEPSATLGGHDEAKMKKKSSKKHRKHEKEYFLPGSHEASVLSLSWNTSFRQFLASGSADTTVKIWDVTTQTCSHTFKHHTDKVQSVQWHPHEAWLLASASFDRTVSLIDCRSGSASTVAKISADPEQLQWNPHAPYQLYIALESGEMVCVDVRNTASPLFTFQAHEETITAMSFSSRIPGLLATSSVDKTVKIWDTNDLSQEGRPRCVAYKTMNVGGLFTLQFNQDDPYMLATAGDKGMVAIWESDEQEVIKNYFDSRVLSKQDTYVGLNSASEVNQSGANKSEMEQVTQQINTAAPAQDDSWMDDNTGIAGAAPATSTGDKKKKKNKKDKK